MVQFGSYNICNGQNKGLESALNSVSQANVDLGVFQEMKVEGGGVYKRESSRYWVMATEALGLHRGGVAVFYREAG